MKKISAPLTISLPASLNDQIDAIRATHGLDSASEAIRLALAKFDMGRYRNEAEPQVQISVRIDPEMRTRLRRISKANEVSVGAIVRAALEALPAKRGR